MVIKMEKKYKHVIWSNRDVDLKDYADFFAEEFKGKTLTETEKWREVQDLLDIYFEDERMNLNKCVKGNILVIADLGLWHGRRKGYKLLNSNNLKDIMCLNDNYITYYSDGKNVKAIGTHHDGTNLYEFRIIREDRNIQNLLNKIYNQQEVTRQQINYYTESLHPYVAKIYGWK